ncbi:glutamine--fructose-6-phosphate transaminase (isomerizing) [uncultured Clostridium sp.]|uniref:glutamine--fructose-6-phosphate transaminase (isomerizing) n=1 Tax=uncultured Clostridium sp. TaxID=59620 RepID=UPI0026311026|nr:glutamine--fructose-6-phosphate transaminase (isomerizing) [uncultured Clostridium sp.]
MCGIVGYIGKNNNAIEVLIEGLQKLEYRGYDSAGIAILNKNNEMEITKKVGKVANLKAALSENDFANIGIGHTRWATHGAPSDINSHPHFNADMSINVVHNGIIENYIELRKFLEEKGYIFRSETDTEVIPHLLDLNYHGDILNAVLETIKMLRGSYALGVLSKNEPNKLIAVKKDSPLIIGQGIGENFIASDIPAVLKYTKDVYIMDDNELAILTQDNITFLNTTTGEEFSKEIFKVTWNETAAEMNGYPHFMLKEINEQPRAIKDTLAGRISADKKNVILDKISLTKEDLERINKIYIVACGTAYHAGMIGKYTIEKLARIPVEIDVASEFRYKDPIIDENTLMIVVSQSGETADTLAALREAKKMGARVIGITNVVGSAVAREASDVLFTYAGPEIAVASTKAYSTQVAAFYLVAMHLAKLNNKISDEKAFELLSELSNISEKVDMVLKSTDEAMKEIAQTLKDKEDMFYLGRGLDYAVALEGSLKNKEISYIHAEAYASGELKHGTIALITDGMPVLALVTQDDLMEKSISNIKETVTRGASVISIATENNKGVESVSDKVVYIPNTHPMLTPLLSVIPLQYLAYHAAIARDCDVDKPRNLAKSVTVE